MTLTHSLTLTEYMVLRNWVVGSRVWYNTKYNIGYYSLIFRFLFINILNYCHFYTDRSTFFKYTKNKNKKKCIGKIKKSIKNAFLLKNKNVYYNYGIFHLLT